MTALAVTNTLSNGATILASEHNTNYSDIVTYINNRNSASAAWDGLSVASSSVVPVVVNNSTGTQDILRAQDNGTNVLVVADGGVVTMGSQSAARVYRNTSAQSISATTITKVEFNAESYDVKSEFDSATNFRFTAGKTGKYLVTSTLTLSANFAPAQIYIYVNGAEVAEFTFQYGASADGAITISDVISLTATDYVEIHVQTDASNTVVNGENLSWLAIHKVA